jgi:hypothetical protein
MPSINKLIVDKLNSVGITVIEEEDEIGITYFKTDADWIQGEIVEFISLKKRFSAISILEDCIVFEFKFKKE